MEKKLLIVNKHNPEKTMYYNHENIGIWILGRCVDDYVFLICGHSATTIYKPSCYTMTAIQSEIDFIFSNIK